MADQTIIKDELYNSHPTDSHYENGVWVPDPINCPLPYQNTSAHDLGHRDHGVKPGYCEAHKALGCTECD